VSVEAVERSGGAVLLRLGEARYALALAAIAEVVPVPVTTRIPDQPAWLAGVANWRGRVLPVVDIRLLLGVPAIPLASSARLVVLVADDVHVGVLAEAVPGVHPDAVADAEPPPATLAGEAALLVRGQVADRFGPIAVLDASALLALRRRLARARSFTS
jgi:purine-binding chemotaxis protein CheW